MSHSIQSSQNLSLWLCNIICLVVCKHASNPLGSFNFFPTTFSSFKESLGFEWIRNLSFEKKKSINHLLITHSLTRTNQILPFLIRASLHVLAHFASTNILVRNKQDFGNLEDHSRWKVNFFPLSFWLFFSLIQILLWMSSKSLRRDAHKLPSNGEGEY